MMSNGIRKVRTMCALYRWRSEIPVSIFSVIFTGMCYNERYDKEKELEEMRVDEKREF